MVIWFIWIQSAPLEAGNNDVVLVLGYKMTGNTIHPLLEERLEMVIQLLQMEEYLKKKVIVSGGVVGWIKSEAEIMKEYLIKHGIEPNRILVENESRDTVENLQFTKKIMEQAGFKSCVIVSNSFHMRRITMIAKNVGLGATCYCKRSLITALKQWNPTIKEIKAFKTTLSLLVS
ncbi:YdcF family protein [Neobacillus pocheonensis]|uniref:YdcF family protein n=1 Tax=Neobacillus pocheonensis TaxID=363869 RepID=A0ABT0WGS8_9BACI|nr:YdcF family protein [Neobacillus pocheonensis]